MRKNLTEHLRPHYKYSAKDEFSSFNTIFITHINGQVVSA